MSWFHILNASTSHVEQFLFLINIYKLTSLA